MRRSAGVGLFLIFMLSLGLSGCGGKGSSTTSTAKVATVTLAPASISLQKGAVFQVAVAVQDKDGKPILTQTPTFASSNAAVVTVSNGGLLCAGTWDSLITPIVCTPAAASGTSNLTAAAGGITSNTVVVSVHDHVDNIVVCRQSDPNPCPLLAPTTVIDCRSGTQATGVTPVNQTEQVRASAYSGGVDITSTVGTFSWFSSTTAVATVANAGPSTTPALNGNEAIIQAVSPGQTSISASISGTNSVPATFLTCSPATISIDVPTPTLPDTAFSFSIAAGANKLLESKVIDTMGTTITGVALTWASSQSAAATVDTAGKVTGAAPGVSLITASCTPPSCNLNLSATTFSNQVYSNAVTATITGTAAATTVYATTTAAPAAGGHTDLIPISTSTNTAGTAIALPTDATINSLLINPAGTRAYLGSSKGLVVVDVVANTVSSTVTNLPGTALVVSPNGQFVVTSDTGAGKVYVFDTGSNLVTTLNIAGATHAAFTTDSFKAYIVAGSTLYQYSPSSLLLRTILMADVANDVAVNTTGQFAYTAGGETNSVAARSTCRNDSTWAPPDDSVGTGFSPDLIASASTGDLLAVEGGSSEIDKLTPTIGAPAAGSCPPTLSDSLTSAGFGVGAFTPRQIIVTPDGSKAYVTSDQTVLLGYNVAGNSTFTVTVGGVDTFTGGALLDSSKVYVGGSDNAVHVIDVASGLEGTPISLSFTPQLVAVRPH
ncbi:MAG: hypothetical protein ACRD3A_01325 [Terriglobales bacterium]